MPRLFRSVSFASVITARFTENRKEARSVRERKPGNPFADAEGTPPADQSGLVA
ncbi:hypothetical protein Rrhod_3738 [Rhodococcus rhodnii LMG 5362]|uniref:Uncharacterized protein n=1 Tax=Rhodococcus rhodnii LMG 5362 TaxID=1273125 RepID=R7WI61_9NOCA|nr:hypothetical protein Rrhod_3738 [Rhodococcus rhodnii LMG 5362]